MKKQPYKQPALTSMKGFVSMKEQPYKQPALTSNSTKALGRPGMSQFLTFNLHSYWFCLPGMKAEGCTMLTLGGTPFHQKQLLYDMPV